MRKNVLESFLTLVLVFGVLIGGFESDGLPGRPGRKQNKKDGWHLAIVKFQNPTSFTTEQYALQVKLQNGEVTAIDFGYGKKVDNAPNNTYVWRGGSIRNDVAVVQITSSNGQESYRVTL